MIWYSGPLITVAPVVLWVMLSTKYLIPLLDPSVRLNSQVSSKLPYFSLVTISPPFPANTKAPSSITQACEGKLSLLADRQFSKFSPSNKNFQPSAFSSAVNRLGEAAWMSVKVVVAAWLFSEVLEQAKAIHTRKQLETLVKSIETNFWLWLG